MWPVLTDELESLVPSRVCEPGSGLKGDSSYKLELGAPYIPDGSSSKSLV